MTGLVLHSKGLSVTRAALVVSPTSTLEAKSITYNSDYEYVIITYASVVPKGKLQLLLTWGGAVGTGTEGLYRSEYLDESNPTGPKKVMLATQFEPNYARRVFPCFDEPVYRAYWTLNINAPTASCPVGISNNILTTDPAVSSGGYTAFQFAQTPVAIPPYLVAFALGDLNSISGTFSTANPRTVRAFYTRPSQVEYVRFALDAAAKFMNYFEAYTQSNYAWNKLDILAIPDFAAGAMENPGLITFRETAMLVDAPTATANASFASRMRVAEVVAHEVAHQWFGNVLAPATWNDLWVAEGSATFWSYLAVDSVFPSYSLTSLLWLNNEWIPAMQADELSTTPSVKRNVSTPAGARAIFDVTTYSKGGSILRHMNNQLSSTELTTIMSAWFRSNGVGAPMTSEAYLALFATSTHPNVGTYGAPLILNASNPIVNFSVPTNGSNVGILTANLQSYSAFYLGQTTEDKHANWTLPITVVTSSSSTSSVTYTTRNIGNLSPTARNITVSSSVASNYWYKANQDGMSYYRTQYPTSNWQNLISAINTNDSRLSTQDRTILLSDAFTFAEIGQLAYSIPLNMTVQALQVAEHNYPVWKAALDELSLINDILHDQSCAGNFHTMLNTLLTPAYEYWTWNTAVVNTNSSTWTMSMNTISKRDAEAVEEVEETQETAVEGASYTAVTPVANDVLLRNLILSYGTDYISSASYVSNATTAVNAYLADPTVAALPVDTAAALLKVAVSHGTFRLWERVWARYLAATEVYEKSRLLQALAWTDLEYKAHFLLSEMISGDETIRSQDQGMILATIAANLHTGPDLIWAFFQQNYATIFADYPLTLSSWIAPLSSFTEAYRATEITNFFTTNADLGVDVSSVVETINDNALWISEYSSSICSYVTSAYPGSKRDTASAA